MNLDFNSDQQFQKQTMFSFFVPAHSSKLGNVNSINPSSNKHSGSGALILDHQSDCTFHCPTSDVSALMDFKSYQESHLSTKTKRARFTPKRLETQNANVCCWRNPFSPAVSCWSDQIRCSRQKMGFNVSKHGVSEGWKTQTRIVNSPQAKRWRNQETAENRPLFLCEPCDARCQP